MAKISERMALVLAGVSFITGMFVGWRLYSFRMKMLRKKRDKFEDRLMDMERKIETA